MIHLRCTQSGHPLAGTRAYPMSSCFGCDAQQWCWSGRNQAQNASCAACDSLSACHPEDVEASLTLRCSACDHLPLCRMSKAQGGPSVCGETLPHCQAFSKAAI